MVSFETVLAHTFRNPQDSVLLSGTLVEGIGNRFSDLDVYVFCDEIPRYASVKSRGHAFVHKSDMNFCQRDDDLVLMTMDYYEDSEIHIDVEYWLKSNVSELVSKVSRVFTDLLTHSDNNYGEFEINRFEHLLLHRCIVGKTIAGDDISMFGFDPSFSRRYSYCLFRAMFNFYWRFKDIAGAIDTGNEYLVRELSRDFLLREIQAFNHMHGCTNTARKWVLTYWRNYCRSVDAQLYTDALDLLFPKFALGYEHYMCAIFDVVDRIHERIRECSAKTSEFPGPSRCLELLDQEIEGRDKTAGRAQAHEFLFRRRAFSGTGPSYYEILKSL
ncbi:hypothetical protein Acid7E03_43470 [Acidisoma sp. 7E03]